MTGGVLSILMVTGTDIDRPAPFVAEHVRVVPAVSFVRVVGEHELEEAMPDSGSVTFQLTVKLLRYQPFVPNVPETLGTITGGVVSLIIGSIARVAVSVLKSSLTGKAAGLATSV